eukprot:13847375-Alexandrium_andersonii.AAC.1
MYGREAIPLPTRAARAFTARLKSVLSPGVAAVAHPPLLFLTFGACSPDPEWQVFLRRCKRLRRFWNSDAHARHVLKVAIDGHVAAGAAGAVSQDYGVELTAAGLVTKIACRYPRGGEANARGSVGLLLR